MAAVSFRHFFVLQSSLELVWSKFDKQNGNLGGHQVCGKCSGYTSIFIEDSLKPAFIFLSNGILTSSVQVQAR
jgi:hypothetical protein